MPVLKFERKPKPDLNSQFHQKEKMRFKVKVGVFLVLIKDGHVLCLRRANTGIEDGFYVVPMGGLNEGETPLEAVVREGLEEVGAILDPNDLTFLHMMYRKHQQPDGYFFYQQDIYFGAQKFEGTIENKEPHKADRVEFLHLDDLPENMAPCVRRALDCIQQGIAYSEFGH